MRILAAVQGEYGKRIAGNISARSPEGWVTETVVLPKALPLLIDEPDEFLPSRIPAAELLLAMIESEGAAQLVPALAAAAGARAAIVPVDSPAWLPPGLRGQIEREMSRKGIYAVFPRPFCTLTEKTAGYGHNIVPYENELISAFAGCFGRPRLEIITGPEMRILEAEVRRGSPCGSTFHAAEKLSGMAAGDSVPRTGLMVHQYPCLASMQPEEIRKGVFEPFMNISGYVMNEEVEAALNLRR